MSSASMVQPVQGYENPDIPAEAKGMTLDDAEVTIYDEDEMEKSLGKGFDIKDIKDGDPDIVGARSQFKIIDWETDEDLLKYEEDYLYAAVDLEDLTGGIRYVFWDLGNVTQEAAGVSPILQILKLVSTVYTPNIDPTVQGAASGADAIADASIDSYDVMMGNFADKYDGTIVERELWDLLDPAEEFDNNDPDTTGTDADGPYVLDPRDWHNFYENGKKLLNYITGYCDSVQAMLDGWYGALSAYFPANYTAINATIAGYPGAAGDDLRDSLDLVSAGLGLTYPDYVLSMYAYATYVVNKVKLSTKYSFPDGAFGLLLRLLEAGQPCCSPGADFIKRAVKEFNIREGPYRIPWISYGEDWLGLMGAPAPDGEVSPIPVGMGAGLGNAVPMGGETIYVYANVEVEVDDAGTVTVEIEYIGDQIDPKDTIENLITPGSEDDPDELDDWEWIFPKASDAPTQMKSGDTIFWESTPMEGPIPGYEVTILIGVSLVSVIGLIYVIMRKRK